MSFARRLVKDYEYLPQTTEACIYLAMARLEGWLMKPIKYSF